MSNPFTKHNGMLMGARGPIVADELDIPSQHTRAYQSTEMDIHAMNNDDALRYATKLRQDIHKFDRQDTLEDARQEGRAVYRSWPENPNASNPNMLHAGSYTSGFSSLTTTRNPQALLQAHRDFEQGRSNDPFTSAPSTLLGHDPDQESKLWSGSGPGMVTSLLPELYYVKMEALNRRVQHGTTSPELHDLNATLRAEVTHPHLFDKKDLSSGVMELRGVTERRGKPSMGSGNPGSDFKLRENATRYQSFMNASSAQQSDIHNEMAVHYRTTGHSEAAMEMTTHMIQPTITIPAKKFLFITREPSRTVPDPNSGPIATQLPENARRDTHALSQTLGQPHTPYKVLKG
ncbi:hypothetical protein [Burkholderia plantarii]|uniref:hypothetical protein n=1 Tax=Burkholderia plantarii TaxID=41899 RepID=UPI0018DB6A04|nr:hypothetical protein [Burkholderia plantarii]MBI0329083.1 hypothetical protein [Burkholderia plantarii]